MRMPWFYHEAGAALVWYPQEFTAFGIVDQAPQHLYTGYEVRLQFRVNIHEACKVTSRHMGTSLMCQALNRSRIPLHELRQACR